MSRTKIVHTVESCVEKKLKNIGLTLQGHSKAGERTGFIVKELGIMLDAGMSTYRPLNYIFISHSHNDHSGSIPFILSGRDGKLPVVVVPEEARDITEDYLMAYQRMNMCNKDGKTEKVYSKLIGVKSGETMSANVKSRSLVVQTVECPHRVPCVGFSFKEKRKKLREDLAGMASKEIGKLVKEGVQVCTEEEIPLFVFLGDTTHKVFSIHPEILSYPYVCVECTYWAEGLEEQALDRGHIHWNQLRPYVSSHPDTIFVLFHFSLATSESETLAFFISQPMKNIILWLDGGVVDLSEESKELVDESRDQPNGLEKEEQIIIN